MKLTRPTSMGLSTAGLAFRGAGRPSPCGRAVAIVWALLAILPLDFASSLALAQQSPAVSGGSAPGLCQHRARGFTVSGAAVRSTSFRTPSTSASTVGGMLEAIAVQHGATTGSGCTLGTTHRWDLGLGAGAGAHSAEAMVALDAGFGPSLSLHSGRSGQHSLFLRGGMRLRADASHSFSFGVLELPQVELGYQWWQRAMFVEAAARMSYAITAGFSAADYGGSQGGVSTGGQVAIGWRSLFVHALYDRVPPWRGAIAMQTVEGRLCSIAGPLGACSLFRWHRLPNLGPPVPPEDAVGAHEPMNGGLPVHAWSVGILVGYSSQPP